MVTSSTVVTMVTSSTVVTMVTSSNGVTMVTSSSDIIMVTSSSGVIMLVCIITRIAPVVSLLRTLDFHSLQALISSLYNIKIIL